MCVWFLITFVSVGFCDILLKTATKSSSLEDCLVRLVDDYFADSKSVLVINYNDRNFLKRISRPSVLMSSSNPTKIGFKVHSVIAFIQDKSIDTIVRITSRTSRTKFVAVVNQENLSIVTQWFWNLKISSVLILVEKQDFIEIFTYFPSSTSEPKLVNSWDVLKRKFSSEWRGTNFLIDFTKYPVNISFMDFPPFVIRDKSVSVTKIAGIEGNMMEILAKRWNFTPNYINRHEKEWGEFEPPSGLVGDVYTGTSVIGFGVLYPFTERLDYLDIPGTHNVQNGAAFVTFKGALKTLPAWVTIFYVEFTDTLWLCVFLSFFISAFFFHRLQLLVINLTGQQGSTTVIKIFGLLLGQGQSDMRIWSVRSFLLSWIWFSFIISSAYQSFLSSKLTAPLDVHNINTIEQLAQSDLIVSGPKAGLMLLNLTGNDESSRNMRKVFEKAVTEPRGMAEILRVIAKDRRNAYMHHYPILKYYKSISKDVQGDIHFLKEMLLPNYPHILLPKGSFLTKDVGKVVSRLNSGGFFVKWQNDLLADRESKRQNEPIKLTIHKFYGLFIAFSAGCGISFLAVLMELAHWKIKSKPIAIL